MLIKCETKPFCRKNQCKIFNGHYIPEYGGQKSDGDDGVALFVTGKVIVVGGSGIICPRWGSLIIITCCNRPAIVTMVTAITLSRRNIQLKRHTASPPHSPRPRTTNTDIYRSSSNILMAAKCPERSPSTRPRLGTGGNFYDYLQNKL